MNYDNFFLIDVPAMLKDLTPDSKPDWGLMDAGGMLSHLHRSVELSLENTDGEIRIPPEKIPAYKAFLMSEKPFSHNLQAPPEFNLKLPLTGDLENKKLGLMKILLEMLVFFKQNPEHTAVHPSFGRLNVEEWLHLHKKHFTHHLQQFHLA